VTYITIVGAALITSSRTLLLKKADLLSGNRRLTFKVTEVVFRVGICDIDNVIVERFGIMVGTERL
jgi:hypothetical protein